MNAPTTGSEEMHPLNTEARIAVMSVEIGHISKTLERIEANGAHAVPRSEWEQRNVYVDGRFVDAFAQITRVSTDTAAALAATQTEIASRRAPWWAIVAAVAGFAAVLGAAFDIIPSIVN